jgi:hypothetical protein
MANPSGMFCSAIVSEIYNPNHRLGPYANPIATPSVKECAVITPRIKNTLIAVAPFSPENLKSSCWWSQRDESIINMSPQIIHKKTDHALYVNPSWIIKKLAAIISAPAKPFATAFTRTHILPWGRKAKGKAHNPVAIAEIREYQKTNQKDVINLKKKLCTKTF